MRFSPQALARSRAIAIAIAQGARRGGRRLTRLAGRPADILEGVRKTTPGAVAEMVVDTAMNNEFKDQIAKSAARAGSMKVGLQKVAGGIGNKISRIHKQSEKVVLKALKNSPILSTAVKTAGAVGTVTGRVTGRVVGAGIELAQGHKNVATARNLGTILSENFKEIGPRQIGRQIRRSKDPFTKNITNPILESLTGKVARNSEGLGSVGKRKYGFFQRLRRTVATDTVKRGELDKQIAARISQRRALRQNFTDQMKSTREALKTQGLTPEAYSAALKQARKVAKQAHRESLVKANSIFGISRTKDKETGALVTRKVGDLSNLVEKRYKGADIDLGSTALVGATTLYVGNQYAKDIVEKVRRSKFMRERKKEDEALRSALKTSIALNHPDLDEYDQLNLVEQRLKQHRYQQAIAAETSAMREAILAGISTAHDSPQTAPKESKMRAIKTKPKALKRVLIKKR